MAAGRPDIARQTLAHIPAEPEAQAQVWTLRAWFAQREGDSTLEQAAWQQLHDLDPGNITALDRLAELATAAGQTDRAAQIRRAEAQAGGNGQGLRQVAHRNRPGGARRRTGPACARARASNRREGMVVPRRDLGSRAGPGRARAAAVGSSRKSAGANAGGPAPRLADTAPSDRRPIRPAPSVAPGATPWFVDDAAAAGLRFVHENGTETARLIPPASASGGVGLLDYDGDGWLDVYVVQGGPFPSGPTTPHDGDRLFQQSSQWLLRRRHRAGWHRSRGPRLRPWCRRG